MNQLDYIFEEYKRRLDDGRRTQRSIIRYVVKEVVENGFDHSIHSLQRRESFSTRFNEIVYVTIQAMLDYSMTQDREIKYILLNETFAEYREAIDENTFVDIFRDYIRKEVKKYAK